MKIIDKLLDIQLEDDPTVIAFFTNYPEIQAKLSLLYKEEAVHHCVLLYFDRRYHIVATYYDNHMNIHINSAPNTEDTAVRQYDYTMEILEQYKLNPETI
jgi:hypothetical protein